MRVPILDTERLSIRPFTQQDFEASYQLFDCDLGGHGETGSWVAYEARREWLRWTVLSYEQLAKLNQPPYGERAIVLSSTMELIGAVGYVPCLDSFSQLRGLGGDERVPAPTTTEFGLFWAIGSAHRGRGYATEAAQAMVEYAFEHLRLRRIVATTAYDNVPSMRVMEKLGMRLERNPHPKPSWLQVVGVLERP